MNEDRIVGVGRELLGKGERKLGDVTGSESLQGDGVVDQVAGAVQHDYGKVRDVISEVVDDAPGTVAGVIDRGRELGRQGDEAIRDRMGDNGPLYLIGVRSRCSRSVRSYWRDLRPPRGPSPKCVALPLNVPRRPPDPTADFSINRRMT